MMSDSKNVIMYLVNIKKKIFFFSLFGGHLGCHA